MLSDVIDLIVCVPCTIRHDRGQADARYLTQLGENSDEATVAFPIEGRVDAWHTRGGIWPSSSWLEHGVTPAPRGTGGRTIVDWVKQNPRFERATIGIAGLTSSLLGHVRETEGEVNWQSVLSIEIEGRWGGYVAQIDQTFAIGPAHQDLKDGMKLAIESYDRVFEAMKPGVTFGELIDAGEVKGMGGRGEASLTMHGRGTGD